MPGVAIDNPSSPSAYYLSLSVSNFRCFKKEVVLNLSNGDTTPALWNIVLGENGVGKTSLLQWLAAMEFRDYLKYQPDTKRSNKGNNYCPRIYTDRPPFLHPLWSSNGSVNIQARIITNSVIDYSYFHERMELGIFHSFTGTDNDVSRHKCFGYGANRRMSRRALSESMTVDPSETLFNDSAELLNAEEWLLQADYARKTAIGDSNSRAERVMQQVIDLVCGILPSGGVKNIRFGLNEDTAVATPRVEAETPYGWVRLRDLSLGYQTALTWMVDLAARMLERYPDSSNPLAEPAIVIVDEIDLHLHPKWQRELIQKLTETFPKTQFIVTAHSPLIVQAAPNANIALLKRVGDHVEIDNDVDHIRNWRADQILTSDLFGLESARPPYLDAAFKEREELLTKPELTDADWKRLDELSEQIGETNEGERTGDMEAQNLIRRAAQLLQKQ